MNKMKKYFVDSFIFFVVTLIIYLISKITTGEVKNIAVIAHGIMELPIGVVELVMQYTGLDKVVVIIGGILALLGVIGAFSSRKRAWD